MEISRDIIETLPIFDPIREKIREALNIAGISIGDLHSVEIIGGASRIPSVTKCVKELFEPVEVGAHINGD